MTPRSPIPQRRYADVVLNDPTLELPYHWREMAIRDRQNWSCKFLRPLIKIVCIGLFWVIKVIKRILPFRLHSEGALNWLSTWFVRRCVSTETEQMLYRHLAVENALLFFAANNCGDTDIKNYYLRPNQPEGLGDTEGMNATLLHDNIILNFFIALGQSEQVHTQKPEQLDFSDLELPEFNSEGAPRKFIRVDFESVLYITVLVLVLFLDDDVMESSVNSLNLDESLMRWLSFLTGDQEFRTFTPGPYVDYMRTPFNVGDALYKHIKLNEYAYVRLIKLKQQTETARQATA